MDTISYVFKEDAFKLPRLSLAGLMLIVAIAATGIACINLFLTEEFFSSLPLIYVIRD